MDKTFFRKVLIANANVNGVLTDAPTGKKFKVSIVKVDEIPKWECWETSETGLHKNYIFRPSGTVAGYVRNNGMLVVKIRNTHKEQGIVADWTMEQILRFVYLKTLKPKKQTNV